MIEENQVKTNLSDHRIVAHVYLGGTNLTVFYDSFLTEKQEEKIGYQIHSSLAYSRLTKPDFF